MVNARLLDAQNLLTRDVAHAIVGSTKQLSLQRLFSHLNKALDAAPDTATHIASQRSHGIVTDLVTLVTDIPSRDYIRRLFVSEEASPLSAALCRMAEETVNLSSPEWLVTRGQQRLAQRFREVLQRIEACERYLACVDASFESLCHETGKPLRQAANNLGVDMAALRLARARFLQSGSYVGLAEIRYRELCNAPLESRSAFTGWLLSHHAKVSAKRKASPWVEVQEDGRINCRLAVERPAPEALAPATAWRNGYYLDALEALARELRARETA
ncbi:hypothetical protein AQ716_09395 [Burkholderia pseudomallei]|nr:hypothetical protein AQ716_09395 [Burkholderia pseudomallei]